ncbi:hypothetical protein LPB03_07505 [Polaribacter vadi]|uniref:tRNA (Guanine-N1)-methyltransferase n=1 Tax=Polaribacter vadi TaxID=1774273 RepID=A0A1B8U368_9FLAO|nr:hypothetical protein [Polaribacter vadi]AOW17312.1 hypothetical protein LPB03_07505 [Polaribacter vadi]OBY66249.1 hypothetical protein LPB3_00890 [Polaribacter vadi]
MKSKILLLLFLAISLSNFSQESEPEPEPQVVEEDNSLEGQFDKIYRISTTYQVYKVIGKDKYLELKKNVLDSLKDAKNLISEKESLLKAERDNIKGTKDLLLKTQSELEASKKNENSISLFGTELSKTNYNLLLWSIIIVSLLALFYFIFKFSQSNVLTKEAQNNLLDVEQEFEEHRKKSLEREQKLRRQLQDEVNKLRNS